MLLVAFDFRRQSAHKQVNSRSVTQSSTLTFALKVGSSDTWETGRHSWTLCFFEHTVICDTLMDGVQTGISQQIQNWLGKHSVLTGISFSALLPYIILYNKSRLLIYIAFIRCFVSDLCSSALLRTLAWKPFTAEPRWTTSTAEENKKVSLHLCACVCILVCLSICLCLFEYLIDEWRIFP